MRLASLLSRKRGRRAHPSRGIDTRSSATTNNVLASKTHGRAFLKRLAMHFPLCIILAIQADVYCWGVSPPWCFAKSLL